MELDLTASANKFALASIGCAVVAVFFGGFILILVSVALATTGLQRARTEHTSPTLAYVAYGMAIFGLMAILIFDSGVL